MRRRVPWAFEAMDKSGQNSCIETMDAMRQYRAAAVKGGTECPLISCREKVDVWWVGQPQRNGESIYQLQLSLDWLS